jgi:hypothetical protein
MNVSSYDPGPKDKRREKRNRFPFADPREKQEEDTNSRPLRRLPDTFGAFNIHRIRKVLANGNGAMSDKIRVVTFGVCRAVWEGERRDDQEIYR